MVDRIIGYTGKLLIHVIQALLVCWQRMLRLGLSVGVLGGLVVLSLGALVTRSFPPEPLTWVTALFFGVAVGYAAAMTVLIDELLLGAVEAIRSLEGDIRAGMRGAMVAAEREAGEAGRGIMRFLGHPRARTIPGPKPVGQEPPSQPLVTVATVDQHQPGQSQADETLEAIAATERFVNTTPRPRVDARPVRADQLPRIGWASDEAEMQRARDASTPAIPALADMPPLPVRTLRAQPRAESTPGIAVPVAVSQGVAGGADIWPVAAEEPIARPRVAASPRAPEADTPPALDASPVNAGGGVARDMEPGATLARQTEAPDGGEEALPRVSDPVDGAEEATTEPDIVSRPQESPAPPAEAGQPVRGIWARIGKALIGNTTVPLSEATQLPDTETSD